MTFAPPTLTALAKLWVANGGVNLGIVGDTSHVARGWSYHLGKDDLADGASSARLARDVAGLSNAASAMDFGKLDGSYVHLREFSKWLVAQCRANRPGTSDIREVIYSPDGKIVLHWDRQRGYATAPVQLDPTPLNLGHLTHTHVSWYRDAEFRDHRTAIAPYFEDETMNSFVVPKVPQIGDVAKGVTLFTTDAMVATDPARIIIDPGRSMPYIGVARSGVRIVEYVDESGVHSGKTYFLPSTQLTNIRNVVVSTPAPDCAAQVAAAVEPLNANILSLQAELATARQKTQLAATEGARAEWDRQNAGATVAVRLLPRP